MPILHLRALPPKGSVDVPRALEQINLAIAEVYRCGPEHVWSTLEWLEPGHYAEGGKAADLQPEATHPPIGELICFEGKSADDIEAVLLAAAKAVGDALGVGDNVFLTYREAKSGEVVAGNGIVRR